MTMVGSTLRDILAHTSGQAYWFNSEEYAWLVRSFGPALPSQLADFLPGHARASQHNDGTC